MTERCGNCGAPATRLCDYVLQLAYGERAGLGAQAPTCDAPICDECATQVSAIFFCGPDGDVDSVDRCPVHRPIGFPQ